MIIPVLIPRSSRQIPLVQQSIPRLATVLQIRDIDDSLSTPGDLVFPSLGVSCLIFSGDRNEMDMLIARAEKVLQRRRCLILAPQDDVWEIQLRYVLL